MVDLCKIKELLVEIHQLEKRLRNQFRISLNESLALCCLSKRGYAPGDLARELELSSSRVSRVINDLEAKGFVNRALSHGDRRMLELEITDTGLEKLDQLKSSGYLFSKIMQEVS